MFFFLQNPGLSADASGAARDLITQTTYNSFSGMMSRTIGEQTGWSQLASVFILTKEAVKVAGAGGAFASRVKDMSLQYIEDKFAGWIVEQGGFVSTLSLKCLRSHKVKQFVLRPSFVSSDGASLSLLLPHHLPHQYLDSSAKI